MPDLFLSYSRDDSLIMGIIRDNLRKLGFNLWIDIEHLKPGTPQWERAVKRAVGKTNGMLVLCSPSAEKSEWVNREIHMAKTANRPVIPLLITGEEWDAIPAGLMGDQYCDMRGRSGPERGFRNLVNWLTESFGLSVPEYQLQSSDPMQIPVVQSINIQGHVEGHVTVIGRDVAGDVMVAGEDIHRKTSVLSPAAQRWTWMGVAIVAAGLIVGYLTLSGKFRTMQIQPTTDEVHQGTNIEQSAVPTPVLQYVEGDVLFEDDFEDGDLQGWLAGEGWSVVQDETGNHVLQGTGDAALVGTYDHTDYAIEARVRVIERNLPVEAYRLIFRDSGDCDQYRWYIDNRVVGRGVMMLERNAECVANNLKTTSYDGPTDEWLTVGVRVRDNDIRTYLNGRLAFDVTDSQPLFEGSVGLAVPEGNIVWFDDVRVVELVPEGETSTESETAVEEPSEENAEAIATPEYFESEVLFEDDFEDGDTDGWSVSEGWDIVPDETGNMVLQGRGDGTIASAGSTDWKEYLFESRVRVIDFESPPGEEGYRLIFRHAFPSNCNYYGLSVQRSNLGFVKNIDCYEISDLYGWGLRLSQDKWMNVVIEITDYAIRVSLDDAEVLSYVGHHQLLEFTGEQPLPTGRIGLMVPPTNTVWFDNVRVIELVPEE